MKLQSLARQVNEGVRIEIYSGLLMNSKSEFHQPSSGEGRPDERDPAGEMRGVEEDVGREQRGRRQEANGSKHFVFL